MLLDKKKIIEQSILLKQSLLKQSLHEFYKHKNKEFYPYSYHYNYYNDIDYGYDYDDIDYSHCGGYKEVVEQLQANTQVLDCIDSESVAEVPVVTTPAVAAPAAKERVADTLDVPRRKYWE